MTSSAPTTASSHVLERGVRLSASRLWQLQRAFFDRQGVDAWRRGLVPQYITTNPTIVGAYARVVAGYLADRAPVDADAPLHIVELGAGSGRFAYLFLRRLTQLLRGARLPLRYVMTDLAARNVEHWRAHPQLRPFVERGVLDFARFDVEHDRQLRLDVSGATLGPGPLAGGLVVIANYFFDGIPQDAFVIRGGQLLESLVTVATPDPAPDPDDPALLASAVLSYESHLTRAEGYYDDPEFDAILHGHAQRLAGTAIRFPIAALRCVRLLRALAGDRMLLLSADKGHLHEDELLGQPSTGITVHGSFSMNVDYHALATYVRGAGGRVLHASHRHVHLLVVGFLFGEHPADHPATHLAFADAIGQFGPDEFFSLKKAIEPRLDRLTLAQLLALLRLAGGDPRVLSQCLPTLTTLAETAPERDRRDLFQVVELVWDQYFHLGEEPDLAFQIGALLHGMEYYPEAATYFMRSLELYGPDAHTLFNLGVCHYHLRHLADALACAEATLALDPDHEAARAMRIELTAQRRATGDG